MDRPDHLAVYLSDLCNLACSYCYVAVNAAPRTRLTLDHVRRAIDEFCCGKLPRGRKITFLGGEPLLDWGLLKGAAAHARERGGPDLILHVFTNGTLLTPAKAAVLSRLDVHCTVSLDGMKSDNDRHRRYRAGRDRSVYDDVLERLRPLSKRRLDVNLVFTPATVDRLLANLEAFRSGGFERLSFSPALYSVWPDESLRAMHRVLSGAARWYRALLDAGGAPQLSTLFDFIQRLGAGAARGTRRHECRSIVLGPDANYYSCDKALSLPAGAAADLRIGNVESGLDWRARRGQLDSFIRRVSTHGGAASSSCALGVVAHAERTGRDPASDLDSFQRTAAVFDQGLVGLIALCRSHPDFVRMYGRVPLD